MMTRAEMVELAAPPCHECGLPVQRVETRWEWDEGVFNWRLGPTFMVCREGHRVPVEPVHD